MKYNQLPIRMQIRYISLVLSLLCLISSCRESGHDPGKELYEQQLHQKGRLAQQVDSLFTSVFTDPLGAEPGLGELYRHSGSTAGTELLSHDAFFHSQITYIRRALSFSLRVHSIKTLLASSDYSHFQTMIVPSMTTEAEEYPATDPTVLLQMREALSLQLQHFLTQEAPGYSVRDPKKETHLRSFVEGEAIGLIDKTLSSYKAFTGRESELEGKVWHQEAYRRGEVEGDPSKTSYSVEKLFGGKILFGREHQLQLDSLQLPTSYYSFTYGYERGRIFKSFEGRGRGQDNSIFAVPNGPLEPTGQRYYFGDRYLTLILPLKPSKDYAESSRYTIAITLEYDPAKYAASPSQLIPRYKRGLNDAGVEVDLNPYLFYSIYDGQKHWGTILVMSNEVPSYSWASPVSFRPAP